MWTRFMDMHSGGGQKEAWQYIYIEAPEEEAKSVFYAKFGHSPDRVSCTCCGSDYSIDDYENLAQATAYERGCEWLENKKVNGSGRYFEKDEEIPEGFTKSEFSMTWNEYQTLEEYLKTVKVIYANEITEEEKKADVPEEGYVWR